MKPKILVNQLLRQINNEGFKDAEVVGKKIKVTGGYIEVDKGKTKIHHMDPAIRKRLITVLKNALQP